MFIPIVSPTVLACKGAIGDTLRMILTEPGSPYVLGATLGERGCNFALFSKNATAVELLLFSDSDPANPTYRFAFDSVVNKTGDIWHLFVPGVEARQLYG